MNYGLRFTNWLNRAAIGLLWVFALHPSTSPAQGSLTPTGAPAPVMKSLDQIEARTPISFAPFTISSPGSYYVTTNLVAGVNQSGILVAADNVTVDLNGFTLFGGGGTVGEGVSASGARANVVVRNGTVRNWPGSGINFYDSGSSLTTVQDIQSISNVFSGIAVKSGSRVEHCVALGNGTKGIIVDNDCVVERCTASENAGGGLTAGNNSTLKGNRSIANGNGLLITGTGNVVADNLVRSNADNYAIAQGNQLDLLLCEVPESIDWPAKVRLVGSLSVTASNAITITANNVALDLNGFVLSSTENPAGTNSAVMLNAVTNVTIGNGFISSGVINNGGIYSGNGFGYGISGLNAMNVRVSGVSIVGCKLFGIHLGSASIVESCTVNTAGNIGILAGVVDDSSGINCGNEGVEATTANNCYGASSGLSDGLYATTANNCYGSSVNGHGLFSSVAVNCYGTAPNDGVGAETAINCYGYSSGNGRGIYARNLAIGCFGWSAGGGTGVNAYNAAFCTGRSDTGTALQAYIANGCIAIFGTNNITYKYNMP